ncbi:MAG TPA: GNAT family N-acetyltransferase [Terriglobia bacterium]|nr:GNAT family N-acetyltransferase [Terriglobia bacterium]
MMTAIRPLGPFDLQLLEALHARCFTAPWDQPWTAASFAEILAMPGAGGWLISEGDQPAGFVLLRNVVDEMEIILIASDPARRRQGFAGRLLDHALAMARRAGAQTVFLEQAAPNLPAQQLYASRGFRQVGRRRGYYRGRDGVSIDAVILRRDLDGAGKAEPEA